MAFTIENGVLTKYTEEAGVTEVIIPEGVTTIGSGAFAKCTSLTSVIIPEGVNLIDSSAFANCTSLTSVIISEGVTRINPAAFAGCTSLQHVEIPSSVSIIDILAFDKTPWLERQSDDYVIGGSVLIKCQSKEKELFVPEGITFSTDGAFDGVKAEIIHLPGSLTDFGTGMFDGMETLRQVTFSDQATEIGGSFCSDCDIETVDFPAGLKSILNDAFYGCAHLHDLVFPDGLEEIGEYAFRYCNALEEIILPDSIKAIEQLAFCDCGDLKRVVLPNNNAFLGEDAFCSVPIRHLHIPASFIDGESISYAFTRNQISEITVDADNPSLTAVDGVLYSKDLTVLYKAPDMIEQITIPETVTKIMDYAFLNCSKLRDLSLSRYLESIGESAFRGCTALQVLDLPCVLQKIGPSAFEGCNSLTSVALPQGLKQIGTKAFFKCTALTAIAIPDSVTELGDAAFRGCAALKDVQMPERMRCCKRPIQRTS